MSKKQRSSSSRVAYDINIVGSIPDNLIERISAIHAAAALLSVSVKEGDHTIFSIESSGIGQIQEADGEPHD